jgi:hypothetical protein
MAEFGYNIEKFPSPPVYPDGKIYKSRFNCLPWERKSGKTMTCGLLPATQCIAYPGIIHNGCYGPNEEAAKRLVDMAKTYIMKSPANLMRFINKRTLSTHLIEFLDTNNKMGAFNHSEKEIRGPDIDYAFID